MNYIEAYSKQGNSREIDLKLKESVERKKGKRMIEKQKHLKIFKNLYKEFNYELTSNTI